MTGVITFAQADALLGKLSQAQIDFTAIQTALRDKGANLSEDADAGDALVDVVTMLAAAGSIVIPGGPLVEAEAGLAAMLIGFVLTEGSQDKPGAQLPPFAGGDESTDPARGR